VGNYLTAVAAILVILVGWITVQQLARRFASRHPEWQESAVASGGCGGGCLCGSGGSAGKGACKRQATEVAGHDSPGG
jgi:hypothetical protein